MFTEGNAHGTMNGTTEVTLVSAPRDSVRRVVKLVNLFNDDTATATVHLYLKDGATLRQLRQQAIPTKETREYPERGVYVLDATTKSIVAKLAGVPALSQPIFSANWGDSS